MVAGGNYARIVADNLQRLFETGPEDLQRRLPARREGDRYFFRAFGRTCVVSPDSICLDDAVESGVLGILISLYALHAQIDPCVVEPMKSFAELPGSMPYAAAFAARTQQALVPHAAAVETNLDSIRSALDGSSAPPDVSGDFSALLYPLPKIALGYVFYRADEDFPASVTCLYSSNAAAHLPTDALADVGEYTSREILRMVRGCPQR